MKKKYLVINTLNQQYIFIGWGDERGYRACKKFPIKVRKAGLVLRALAAMGVVDVLQRGACCGVIVASGPGGFSATREGVTIANCLAWVHDLPLAGITLKAGPDNQDTLLRRGIVTCKKKKQFSLVAPYYNLQPNITVARVGR